MVKSKGAQLATCPGNSNDRKRQLRRFANIRAAIIIPCALLWRAPAAAEGCRTADESQNFVLAGNSDLLPQRCDISGECHMFGLDGRQIGAVGDFQKPNGSSEGLVAVRVMKTQLEGYMDGNGNWAIEPKYLTAEPFCEGRAAVRLGNGRWTYIERTGMRVGETWDAATTFTEGRGLVGVESAGKWAYGYVDVAGKLIIPTRFAAARLFSGGHAAIRVEVGKWGYIDRDGHITIEPRFLEAGYFHGGRAEVREGPVGPPTAPLVDMGRAVIGDDPRTRPNSGLIEETGKFVIEPRYDHIYNLDGVDLWVVRDPGPASRSDREPPSLYRLADRGGRFVSADRFDSVGPVSEGLFEVCRAGKCGFADRSGKPVIPMQFKFVGEFSEGLAAVTPDGEKYGYIDHGGKFVIEPRYEGSGGFYDEDYVAGSFADGLAPVGCGGYWGFIDKSGAWVAPPLYRHTGVFANGFADVMLKTGRGHIRRDGTPIDFTRSEIDLAMFAWRRCGAPLAKDIAPK